MLSTVDSKLRMEMKANAPKRKVFQDALDFLAEDRLEDMVQSIRVYGVLNPVIVRKATRGYEMLAGHNKPTRRK